MSTSVSRSRQRSEKLVAGAGSCSPSQGSGQRGWNLSLERWGENSVSGGIHCSWGGRLGRLFSASNNTASGGHCCRVKGPNWGWGGGHTGEGTIPHSGQWERRFHVWAGAAAWVECWGFVRLLCWQLTPQNCSSRNPLLHTFWSCLVMHVCVSSSKGSPLHLSSAHSQSRAFPWCDVFERSCR